MLNPRLHARLERAIGHVRVGNEGAAMQVLYRPDWTPVGVRLKAHYIDRGETYYVNCPLCNDTRRRLAVSYRWAERDARTRDFNLHLVKCFNEDCMNNGEAQKQLHAMVYPTGRFADEVNVPAKPVKRSYAKPRLIELPPSTPLDQLDRDHPACRYLRSRGFSPERLARQYGVTYTDECRDSDPPLRDRRIIVPLYEPASVTEAGATLVVVGETGVPRTVANDTRITGVRLVGWQARAILDDLPKTTPKYLTATGTPKSKLLYGLPTALRAGGGADVIVVEGVADAWKVGTAAVALLGKTLSAEQCKLITCHFPRRRIVVWLDAEAGAEAAQVGEQIRRARSVAGDRTPVVVARTPDGRGDPGECSAAEVRDVIARAWTDR